MRLGGREQLKVERRPEEERNRQERVEALTREIVASGLLCPAYLGVGKGSCGLRATTYSVYEHLNLNGTHIVSFVCARNHTWYLGFDADYDEPRIDVAEGW